MPVQIWLWELQECMCSNLIAFGSADRHSLAVQVLLQDVVEATPVL